MSRSLRKVKTLNYTNIRKFQLNKISDISELKNLKSRAIDQNWFLNKTLFILWSKTDIILDFMVGFYILVYNGNSFNLIFIKENMVNFKVGEFVITKKLGKQIHEAKSKRKKNKK